MGKFRKKPVVIDAVQWLGTNADEIKDFADEQMSWKDLSLYIHTLEGVMRADAGDWIIKGVKGEIYPCKNDVFEATYEPA